MTTQKTIFITGASSGIGKATAEYFAAQGWNVAATMRNPSDALTETSTLKKFVLDVQDKSSISKAVKDSIAAFGKIDVVLNNAGYGTAGVLESGTDEQIRRQFDVNFFGLVDVIRTFLPHFRENKSGLFMNVSSIGGLITLPMFSIYHATKWAVEGLTESLQYELNPLGIELKLIEPGGVKTDFAGRSLDMFQNETDEHYQKTITRMLKNFEGTERSANYSTPEQMAEGIFNAATDGKKQLRYVLGNDAQQLWQARQNMPYQDFREMIRGNMLG
ncbi:SDR family oxidoreductase [Bernardetia sp.]|uniref:SDR family oxidoreductase n=1 Tax=Bernardetia sp. TaxID=1937974 RepID=UPI0025BF97BB|nr:SDR family oxidoreductase [Bernardetia sp.]